MEPEVIKSVSEMISDALTLCQEIEHLLKHQITPGDAERRLNEDVKRSCEEMLQTTIDRLLTHKVSKTHKFEQAESRGPSRKGLAKRLIEISREAFDELEHFSSHTNEVTAIEGILSKVDNLKVLLNRISTLIQAE